MNSDPLTDLHLSHNHHLVHAQESTVQHFQAAFLRSPPTPNCPSQSPRLLPPVDFPHRTSPTPHTAYSSRDDESWEVRAFAEDTSCDDGLQWPPRSYSCSFCRREFNTAQALGGHMNIHRRQRALVRAASANTGQHSPFPLDGSVYEPSGNVGSTGYCLPYPAHRRNTLTIPQRSVSQNLLTEISLPRTNPTSIPFLMPVNQDKPPSVATSLTLAPYNPSTNISPEISSLQQQPQMDKSRQNENHVQGLRSVKVVAVGRYFDENKSEVIDARKGEEHSLPRLSTRKEMCKQLIDLELRLGPSSPINVSPTSGCI